MDLIKIITSFRIEKGAIGYSIEYVYSVINSTNGEYIQKNLVKNIVVTDTELLSVINKIEENLVSKIPDVEV